MTSDCFWRLFIETGEPAYYLLYREAMDSETDEKTA